MAETPREIAQKLNLNQRGIDFASSSTNKEIYSYANVVID